MVSNPNPILFYYDQKGASILSPSKLKFDLIVNTLNVCVVSISLATCKMRHFDFKELSETGKQLRTLYLAFTFHYFPGFTFLH